MARNPNEPTGSYHAGPGTAHEIGVMMGFIAVFLLVTAVYLVLWKIGNKKGAAKERERRHILHEKAKNSQDTSAMEALDMQVNPAMPPPNLPANVHISEHPCLLSKLSLLRSVNTNARDTKALIHEISLILGCEALGHCLQVKECGTDKTPLGHQYTMLDTTPSLTLVPILRSGLGMLEAFQLLLPHPVPVHHLGLYREPSTLQAVEYYNNLPYHRPLFTAAGDHAVDQEGRVPQTAILLDPVIATGGTASAAIQTLLEWGVRRVVLISIVGNREGVARAAAQAHEYISGGDAGEKEVEIWTGAVDEGGLDGRGMIMPGLGDVGDRLFGTVGK
ncbi:MAG: hypothetical protein Q9163_004950 [Psora crenata]